MRGLRSTCPHPGSEELTARMAALATFHRGDKVLDYGCGTGGTLVLLKERFGLEMYGAEARPELCDGEKVFFTPGKELPFDDCSLDGIIMECSLSCMPDMAVALRECRRVLKADGTLAVSDMYAGAEPGILMSLSDYTRLFVSSGFRVYYDEDASRHLRQCFGQLLFEGGGEALEAASGIAEAERKRMKPGYHVWILIPDDPDRISAVTDGLPFMTEASLVSHGNDASPLLKASPKDIVRVITVDTSGSTGEKKRIFFTEKDLQGTADFFTPGMAPMIKSGESCAVFMRGSGIYSIPGLLRIALERLGAQVIAFGEIMDAEAAAETAKTASCLVGYPGDMAALAALYPDLRPESVLLSGDLIPESIVRRIRDVWDCPVFRHWGMTETGYGGAVDRGDGLYRLRRDLIAEIVSPGTGERCEYSECGGNAERPATPLGEIVISAPDREGMPLFRYRTGDLGRIAVLPDGSMALTDLRGRLTDEQVLENGTKISIHTLDQILYNEIGLVYYEAELKARSLLRVGFAGSIGEDRLRELISAACPGLHTEFYRTGPAYGKRRLKITDENCSDL